MLCYKRMGTTSNLIKWLESVFSHHTNWKRRANGYEGMALLTRKWWKCWESAICMLLDSGAGLWFFLPFNYNPSSQQLHDIHVLWLCLGAPQHPSAGTSFHLEGSLGSGEGGKWNINSSKSPLPHTHTHTIIPFALTNKGMTKGPLKLSFGIWHLEISSEYLAVVGRWWGLYCEHGPVTFHEHSIRQDSRQFGGSLCCSLNNSRVVVAI